MFRFFKYEYETPRASLSQWSQRAFRFPYWDNKKKSYLTGEENEVFGLFRSISSDYEAVTKEKQDKSCDLSCQSSGGRTRTSDLRVMSPTSYRLLYPAVLFGNAKVGIKP